MDTQWELWDDESGNLIWTYRTEADALAQVQEYLRAGGEVAIVGLSLVRSDDGVGGIVASDEALAARVRGAVMARAVAD